MEIQLFHLDSLVPNESFGKVGKALEVYSAENGVFRCQVVELEPGKAFDPHVHVSAHIIYVIEGSGQLMVWSSSAEGHDLRVDDQSRRSYAVSKGDLFVIPRGVVHAMSASPGEKLKELIVNVPGIALHDHRRILWA